MISGISSWGIVGGNSVKLLVLNSLKYLNFKAWLVRWNYIQAVNFLRLNYDPSLIMGKWEFIAHILKFKHFPPNFWQKHKCRRSVGKCLEFLLFRRYVWSVRNIQIHLCLYIKKHAYIHTNIMKRNYLFVWLFG